MRKTKAKSQVSVFAGLITLAVIAIIFSAITSRTSNTNLSLNYQTNTPASITLLSPLSGNVDAGNLEHILWQSTNYIPKDVSVNIIRKTSVNPDRYQLVRTVASATSNDGSAVWVPSVSDVGNNTYVEVGCALSSNACTASPLSDQSLAVVNDGRFANTAAAFQAIESANNK